MKSPILIGAAFALTSLVTVGPQTIRFGGYVQSAVAIEKAHVKTRTLPKDRQDRQMEASRCLASRHRRHNVFATADDICQSPAMKEIRSGRHYRIADLTHSHPYLLPEASALLDTIGVRFRMELEELGGRPANRLEITSVTRSAEDQKRLRRVNRNATREESTHSYGTSFDISYTRFPCNPFLNGVDHWLSKADLLNVNQRNYNLSRILNNVLADLRDEGKLYVIKERNQSCYHITARCN